MLNYFTTGFSALANAIRQEQMQGTLESVLLTPVNVPTVVAASSAWAYIDATFNSFLYLFFGWLFFNVNYKGNLFLALTFLILTTLVLASIGILSASFAMVFKLTVVFLHLTIVFLYPTVVFFHPTIVFQS